MRCYLVVQPPSIVRVDPVTCLASSLQRYNTIKPTWTMSERERKGEGERERKGERGREREGERERERERERDWVTGQLVN